MKVKLLTLNEQTLNGNIYSSDVVKKAIEEYVAKGAPIVIQREFRRSCDVDLESVVGTVEDIEYADNELLGTIKVFPGQEHFLGLSVRPSFIGKINPDRTITDLKFLSFNFTADPA
jgi:hypothetical protein